MSQQKVSDYFKTRKRACADSDLIAAKEKKNKLVEVKTITQHKTPSPQPAEPTPQPEMDKGEVIRGIRTRLKAAKEKLDANKDLIKASGKKSVNIDELKQRIQGFNKKLLDHNEKYSSAPQPTVLREKELNAKSEHEKAHNKFENLADAQMEHKFVLPVKFSMLLDLFKGSDTTVKLLHNRQEICTFLKLKNTVQNMIKKNFTQTTLGQIKTVYPLAYEIKQEKLFIDYKNDYHMVISANIEQDIQPNDNGQKLITPQMLLQRLDKFRNRLYEIVHNLHSKFLKSIGVEVNEKEIKRWHAKFELDDLPDIDAEELPLPPNEVKLKCGEDLKNIAKDVYSTRVKSAIENMVAEKEIQTVAKPKETPVQKVAAGSLHEKRNSSYNALLEKIKLKEKHKEFENMVINSDKEKRLMIVEKYSDATRFLKSYFQAEKKSIIDVEMVCNKMSESNRSCTPTECEQLIEELCKDFAKWISVIKVRNLRYVKLDKSVELMEIQGKIDAEMVQLKA